LNAQYAEESYQLKRENCNLKKQIEQINYLTNNNDIIQTKNGNSSGVLETSNDDELEVLLETVDRLSAVSLLSYSYDYITLFFLSKRKIVVYNQHLILK
jgi:hypothetical protein